MPVGPNREPPGAPIAGARVVVVVWAAGRTGVGVTTVVGTVVAGVVGTVTGGEVVVGTVAGAVVAAVTAAVTGCETDTAGFDPWATGDAEPPAKATTVPPAPPRTATIAIPVSTILFLMDRTLRPPHQPVLNTGATLSRLYTQALWTSKRSKPSVS